MPAGCLACDLAEGRVPLPGGNLLDSGRWLVEHCIGPLGVGTLVVKPLRHVLHVADLDERESAELGPLLARTADVAGRLTAAEQVYVCLWSHAGGTPVHLHFVVQPVTSAQKEAWGAYGPALQLAMFERGEQPDAAAVEAFADRARALFARA
jgi:diadenosine tetraphosphate (Ap4A) HIT family hydrolase